MKFFRKKHSNKNDNKNVMINKIKNFIFSLYFFYKIH